MILPTSPRKIPQTSPFTPTKNSFRICWVAGSWVGIFQAYMDEIFRRRLRRRRTKLWVFSVPGCSFQVSYLFVEKNLPQAIFPIHSPSWKTHSFWKMSKTSKKNIQKNPRFCSFQLARSRGYRWPFMLTGYGGFLKWWVFHPNHPFVRRVFHDFHRPFWGGNTHIVSISNFSFQVPPLGDFYTVYTRIP